MAEQKLDIEQIISYWASEAEEALRVAEHLFEKEDYSYALFFGHLAIEKIFSTKVHKKVYGYANAKH